MFSWAERRRPITRIGTRARTYIMCRADSLFEKKPKKDRTLLTLSATHASFPAPAFPKRNSPPPPPQLSRSSVTLPSKAMSLNDDPQTGPHPNGSKLSSQTQPPSLKIHQPQRLHLLLPPLPFFPFSRKKRLRLQHHATRTNHHVAQLHPLTPPLPPHDFLVYHP